MAMHGVVCVSILTSHSGPSATRRAGARPPRATRQMQIAHGRRAGNAREAQAAIMAEVKLKEPSRAGDAAPPRQVDSRGAEV